MQKEGADTFCLDLYLNLSIYFDFDGFLSVLLSDLLTSSIYIYLATAGNLHILFVRALLLPRTEVQKEKLSAPCRRAQKNYNSQEYEVREDISFA